VLDNKLDTHVLRYKEARIQSPNFKPGWVESAKQNVFYKTHQSIMNGSAVKRRVDTSPPEKAMLYRSFLMKTSHTAGGVPRAVSTAAMMKHLAKHRPLTGTAPPLGVPPSHSIHGSRAATAASGNFATISSSGELIMNPAEPRPESRECLPSRRMPALPVGFRKVDRSSTPFTFSRGSTPVTEIRIATPSMSMRTDYNMPLPPIGDPTGNDLYFDSEADARADAQSIHEN